jgi:hypothetical protein
MKIVGPAEATPIDKDLRHRPAALGATDHLLSPPGLLPEIDLDKLNSFARQEPLRPVAEGTHRSGVDLDRGHWAPGFQVTPPSPWRNNPII